MDLWVGPTAEGMVGVFGQRGLASTTTFRFFEAAAPLGAPMLGPAGAGLFGLRYRRPMPREV